MLALLVSTALIAFAEGNCEFCSSGITNDTLILPDFLNLPESKSSCADLTTIDTEPLDRFACAGLQAFQNYCCPGDGIYACEFCSSGVDDPETFLPDRNMTCAEYQYRAIFADEEKCNEDFKPMKSRCCSQQTEPPDNPTTSPTQPLKTNDCVFCRNGLINDTLVMPEFLNLPASISSCAKLNAIDTEPLDKFACAGLLSFQNYCCPGPDVFACDFCSSGLVDPDAMCSQFQSRAVFLNERQCQENAKEMEIFCCPTATSSGTLLYHVGMPSTAVMMMMGSVLV